MVSNFETFYWCQSWRQSTTICIHCRIGQSTLIESTEKVQYVTQSRAKSLNSFFIAVLRPFLPTGSVLFLRRNPPACCNELLGSLWYVSWQQLNYHLTLTARRKDDLPAFPVSQKLCRRSVCNCWGPAAPPRQGLLSSDWPSLTSDLPPTSPARYLWKTGQL